MAHRDRRDERQTFIPGQRDPRSEQAIRASMAVLLAVLALADALVIILGSVQ